MSILKLNGLRLSKMIIAGANELTENKQLVDSMNVFPVPDGDTGTNMSLTVLAAARETEKSDSLRIDDITRLAAGGALRGARGNSGVITSQLFRGFSKALEGLEEADAVSLAEAFERAVETAYKAVMKPKEGTILTVARACAEEAARLVLETEDIEEILRGVIYAGHEMLNKTPEMLPVLKQAGVVDAGGRGLLFIFEGALKHISDDEVISIAQPADTNKADFAALAAVDHEDITFGYCTEFFINVHKADEGTVQTLKSYLGTIGDSIVCVNDDDIIKIHVHTDHPGLAIEKALTIGSLSGLKIDNMREQHTSRIDFSNYGDEVKKVSQAASDEREEEQPKKAVGYVSVAAGEGLSEIFKSLGVDEIIQGGQTMNPSTEDILNAVDKINAESVIILPNNKNIILAAEQAIGLCEDKRLFVIPTRSVPQGIAAMLCAAEDGSTEEISKEMMEAIKEVNTVSVTYAVRDTAFGDKHISQGNILCMHNDEITVVAEDVQEGTKDALREAVKEDSEMICIYYGADVTKGDAEEIKTFVEESYPECEVELQRGGQPLYYYIISIE